MKILCLLWFHLSTGSTAGGAQPSELRLERLTIEDGISQSTVHAIIQDQKGFMWIGTQDGLNRFDGYKFNIYRRNQNDPRSLSGNYIKTIFVDRQGHLWVGTRGNGLNLYLPDEDGFQKYSAGDHPGALSHQQINVITQDADDWIWVGTANGLDCLTSSGFEQKLPEPEAVLAMHQDGSGNFWLGTENGLLHWDRTADRFTRYRSEDTDLAHNRIHHIEEDHQGLLWIGTQEGLSRLDPKTGTFKTWVHHDDHPDSLSHNRVGAVLQDKTGVLWIATWGGLDRYDQEQDAFVTARHNAANPNSLCHDMVLTLYESPSGLLWIGTHAGLNKFDHDLEKIAHYRHDPANGASLSENMVMALHEDRKRDLWVGTWGGGLNHMHRDSGTFTHYRHDPDTPDSLSSDVVMSIHEDRSGDLWVGTWGGGLNRLGPNKKSFQHYQPVEGDPQSLSDPWLQVIHEDELGRLWIGTSNGLNMLDASRERFQPWINDPNNPHSLVDNMVLMLHEDAQGRFWVGTWGGLNLFDREADRFTRFVHNPNDSSSISHNAVFSVYEDPHGVFWVGTWGGGLNRFTPKDGVFKRYGMEHGLANEVINGILPDGHGLIWMSTNRGLSSFDPMTETFKNYDTDDGLQGLEFNSGAWYGNDRGELFFGGINGFNIFTPSELVYNPHKPKLAITDFLLFNQSVPLAKHDPESPLKNPIGQTQKIVLPYYNHTFAFEFAALHYGNPSRNRYAYKMDRIDDQWLHTDADRRFATYTRLDPGKYTFRMKGSNKDGVWNEEGVQVQVHILPPWWRSQWAFAFYLILLLAVLFRYQRAQDRKLKEQAALAQKERLVAEQLRDLNRDLDHKVSERTQELREKHEQVLESRSRLEEQAKGLEEQAQRLTDHDQMKTRFFTNLNHELRTPLTLLNAGLEELGSQFHGALPDPAQRRVRNMTSHAHTLLKLINQMLDLSRLEAGGMILIPQNADLVAFVRSWTRLFSNHAERNDINLNLVADLDKLMIRIDPDKMEKVFTNLMSNAFKFTPKSGNIRVCVSLDHRIAISVKDSGHGIPKEEQAQIFDRFYQAGNPVSGFSAGSGIGLSLARELVRLHDGDLEVVSEYGFGSEFIISLPLKLLVDENQPAAAQPEEPTPLPQPEELEDEPPPADPGPDGEKPAVLIVDDHPEIRSLLHSHLRRHYQVFQAEHAATGLDIAWEKIPDIIISDVMMPGIDGYEMCRLLKTDARTSHIPVILLTARAGEEQKLAGLETGADAYLVKPFSIREVLIRIRNLINARRTQAPSSNGAFVLPERKITSADEAFLKRAAACVDDHLANADFGVFELAEEVGFGRRQLHRKLKAITGLAPADFMRRIRLERAAAMLTARAGGVAEIAAAVGFRDARHFSSAFREHYGVSPSRYNGENKNASPIP